MRVAATRSQHDRQTIDECVGRSLFHGIHACRKPAPRYVSMNQSCCRLPAV
jgi:hypothetical protein